MKFDLKQYIQTPDYNFFLIAGPCVIEGEEMAFEIAEKTLKLANKFKVPYIFKGSYKKANRSRNDSFTGIGDTKALEILKKVGDYFHIPVLTDIHEPSDAEMVKDYVDVLQIPAFLCRQTDLLIAAAQTGKNVNIKKGQFLAPETMKYAVEKVNNAGNDNVWVTERGTTFGYGDLIVDMRGFPEMKKSCRCPIIIDATHSLQQPNQSSGVTGGRPDLITTIALSSLAAGADGVFIETHPNPALAKSDGANMLPLSQMGALIGKMAIMRRAYLNTI